MINLLVLLLQGHISDLVYRKYECISFSILFNFVFFQNYLWLEMDKVQYVSALMPLMYINIFEYTVP